MRKMLLVAGALALAAALPAAEGQDPYYWYHEAICSTSLTDQVPLFDKSLADNPKHLASIHGKGVVLYRRGDYRQAIEMFQEELKGGKAIANAYYDLACCYSLKGDKAEAVEHLKKAVSSGFSDWTLMRADKDLDPIRDEPQVGKLMRGHRGKKSAAKAGGKGESAVKPSGAGSSSETAKPSKMKTRKGKRGKKPAGEAKPEADASTPTPPPAASDSKPAPAAAAPSASDFDPTGAGPTPPAPPAPAPAAAPAHAAPAAAPAKAPGK